MDTRQRESEKRYRTRDGEYKTISLTMDKDIVKKLEEAVSETDDKNMSQYIEENVINEPVFPMPKRREFSNRIQKKTFTFTEEFVSLIKASGNMSLFVESVLSKKL